MRYLISTILIALFLWGCDNAAAVPGKAIVVRKKITAQKVRTAQVPAKKAVRTAQPKPAAKQPNRPIVAKSDNTRPSSNTPPPVKQDTFAKPRIAEKAITKPVQSSPPSRLQQKKPAISPKSDITEIKQVRPASIGQTVAVKKPEEESRLIVASTGPLGGTPPRYNPKGKIDPFDPLIKDSEAVAKKGKKIKREPRTPLERIDLGQLKLVGIILAASGNRALVEESSGKGYVVKNGTYIGTNGGKIVNIQKEAVHIEEKFEDIYGKIQTRQRELKLPKPPGEF